MVGAGQHVSLGQRPDVREGVAQDEGVRVDSQAVDTWVTVRARAKVGARARARVRVRVRVRVRRVRVR